MAHRINPGEAGFTYLTALFLVAILSLLTLTTVETWKTIEQREKEKELLFVGEQYRHAIGLYYELSPGSVKKYPATVNDLLQDKRATRLIRPLRQLFLDPMNSSPQWGIVEAPGGGIMGVFSLSTATPIKQDGFTAEEADFTGQAQYQGWKFIYTPPPIVTKK
ncbi:type II secretory pathway pseudopilin PulG [Oxalobacteraceae bacterium GrIS 2.11]